MEGLELRMRGAGIEREAQPRNGARSKATPAADPRDASGGSNCASRARACPCSACARAVGRNWRAACAHSREALMSVTVCWASSLAGASSRNRLDGSPDSKQRRKPFFGSEQQMLVERIGIDRSFEPAPVGGDDRERGGLGLRHPEVVLNGGRRTSRARLRPS